MHEVYPGTVFLPSKKAQAESFRLRHNAWSTPAGPSAGTGHSRRTRLASRLSCPRFVIEFGDDQYCRTDTYY